MIETSDTFDDMPNAGNGLSLLNGIQDTAYKFESQKYLLH
jgi:hypothetical protein